ncbi:YlbF family regulator [Peptococcaceae bacterium 1198_IL3148]
MNEVLQQKAKELGNLITQTEEYKRVKELQAAMFADEKALAMLKEVQQLQNRNQNKQKLNELTKEDLKEVEQAELKMLENDLIKSFHEAQTDFQRLLNFVMKDVIEASK